MWRDNVAYPVAVSCDVVAVADVCGVAMACQKPVAFVRRDTVT